MTSCSRARPSGSSTPTIPRSLSSRTSRFRRATTHSRRRMSTSKNTRRAGARTGAGTRRVSTATVFVPRCRLTQTAAANSGDAVGRYGWQRDLGAASEGNVGRHSRCSHSRQCASTRLLRQSVLWARLTVPVLLADGGPVYYFGAPTSASTPPWVTYSHGGGANSERASWLRIPGCPSQHVASACRLSAARVEDFSLFVHATLAVFLCASLPGSVGQGRAAPGAPRSSLADSSQRRSGGRNWKATSTRPSE